MKTAAFLPLALGASILTVRGAGPTTPLALPANHPLEFIDTSFENASPVWYEFASNGIVVVHLLYDHERSSPNRAAGHIHIKLHAKPGARLTLEFKNLDNVWNGVSGSVARELKTLVISEDGRRWKSIPTESLPENRIQLHVDMPGPRLYVARVEPYRLSDLDTFLAAIRTNPLVQISGVGKTVQGRELEIVANWKSFALAMPALRIASSFAPAHTHGKPAAIGSLKDSFAASCRTTKTPENFSGAIALT
jgi:hypothetical protein